MREAADIGVAVGYFPFKEVELVETLLGFAGVELDFSFGFPYFPSLRCLACFTSAAVRGFAWFCFLCLDVCCLLEPVLRFFAVVRVVFCCCFCAKTGSAIWPPNRAEISIMIPRRRFIARIRRC